MGTVAIVIAVPGAQAQVAASAGSLTRVTMTQDSANAQRTVILRLTPLLDSLIRRQQSLPVGSPEALSVDSAIQATLRDFPKPAGFDRGNTLYRVEVTSPRVALRASPMDVVPQGTMGFTAVGVNRSWYDRPGAFIQYFEYPTVVAIETNSPASRAGVRSGDSLLAYDGRDLRQYSINMTQLLTPGREVSVRLRRGNEAKDVVITVDKASPSLMAERRSAVADMMAANTALERQLVEGQAIAAARGESPSVAVVRRAPTAATTVAAGGMARASVAPSPMGSLSGVLGAAMTNVDADLASSLRGMQGKHGVLVTVVPEGSIASRAGLRGGDVILRVESSEVASVPEFRVRLNYAEASGMEKIKLTILRAGKTQELYYVPPR
jgi:membrane-associated protease RseP (regulator of RpoE activity)